MKEFEFTAWIKYWDSGSEEWEKETITAKIISKNVKKAAAGIFFRSVSRTTIITSLHIGCLNIKRSNLTTLEILQWNQ